MKKKHIAGIIGIVITILGWIIGNSNNFYTVNRLLVPKYHKASMAYQKMHEKGFILQKNDIGFREIGRIIKDHIEGNNIPDLLSMETINFGTSFVNTANGQETQKYIEFKITFTDNELISGKILRLDEKIKEYYLTKQLFIWACSVFWVGIIISCIAFFIESWSSNNLIQPAGKPAAEPKH